MKKILLMAVALVVLAAQARAQDQAPVPAPAASPVQVIPMVSGPAADALQLAAAASAAAPLADGPWSIKNQVNSLPSLALAQSFTSLDQAVGLHKDLCSLYKGTYEMVRVGGFAGFYKPILSAPSEQPRSIGGGTVLIPGSAFDWAMGTNYGSKYLPALKSGILVAYDVTRLNRSGGLRPDFVGPILSYKLGSTN